MTFTLDRVTVKCNWHSNTQSEWILPGWPLENSCLFSDRLRPGVPQVKLHCVDLVQQFNKKQPDYITPGNLQTFLVMDENKGPRVIRFVILTKQQCFFSKETESFLLLFFCLVCMLCWCLIVLIQATDRRDPERDGPSHSTLLSLFYFSHVVGRGKEGRFLFQNQIQTPLLIVTHTDTKDTHLFSLVSPQFHSPLYAAFAREKHYN